MLAVSSISRAAGSGAASWFGITLGSEKTDASGGIPVADLVPGAPAERAGIVAGDQILQVGTTVVHTRTALISTVKQIAPGTIVDVTVRTAAGAVRTVKVKAEAKPDPAETQHRAIFGKSAPNVDFDFVTSPLPEKHLADLHGKVVLLDFFATWCGPCMEALPHLSAWQKQYGKKGLVVIGISDEEAPQIATLAKRVNYPLSHDTNSKAAGHYQVFALPTLVLVDNGVVKEVSLADVDQIEAALAKRFK